MVTSKYRAVKTEYDGVKYDSKLEAKVAETLDLLIKTGNVIGWDEQVKFELVPKAPGRRAVIYKADFVVQFITPSCPVVKIVEVKGYSTQAWKIKEKLFRYKFPDLDLRVVKKPSDVVKIAQELNP